MSIDHFSRDLASLQKLVDAGLFEDCLQAMRGAQPREPAAMREAAPLLSMRRLCLARLGRFDEAAEAGARLLETEVATTEDRFRQAQILLRLGRHREALPLAIAALLEAPLAPRHVATAVEAALLTTGGTARLSRSLADLPIPAPPPKVTARAPVLFPQHLVFNSGRFDHPSIRGLFATVPNIAFEMPDADPWRLLRHLPTALERASSYMAMLLESSPHIDPATTACFTASRLHAWTEPAGDWAFDFLSPYPASLGQRPWVFCHDALPCLFLPMLPHDDMTVTPDDGLYWIMKRHLESERCLRILTHQPRTLGGLADFFDSRIIERKSVHVNTWHRSQGRSQRPRPERAKTWLFTSSFFPSDLFFRMRGGIETLCAFLTLSKEFPDIELILRSHLPSSLPDGLTEAAANHPRIRHYPEAVDADTLAQLYAEADLYLMPCPIIYRNGLAEALQAGLVPVVANTFGIEDFVRDGENGLVIGGLESIARLGSDPPEFVYRTAELWSNRMEVRSGFLVELEDRLRRLLRTPEIFAHLAANNRTKPSEMVFGQLDATAFADCMHEALSMASRMHPHTANTG
ncbi:glycosyltransferase (plasmid) [Azospirillum sp. HJ39]|uniref:glycosyltransferase n=1 Tax=Azospirillum sp. HJ39 TaxID=3159496 RepID=UPI00355708C9